MKLFRVAKDGGPDSRVTGYWLIEAKRMFSICLLRFDGQSREAFHTHAFNAVSWVLSGGLTETFLDGRVRRHRPSLKPIFTPRDDFHKVDSDRGVTWVLTFRGPWADRWREFLPNTRRYLTLASGRQIVSTSETA